MRNLSRLGLRRARKQELAHHAVALAVLAFLLAITPAMAQVGKGLSGPHFQINIIGVPKDKKVDMSNPDRRTIFVPLNNDPALRNIKIFVTGDTDPVTPGTQCGNDFAVLDGNATDDGEATLLVPCQLGGTLSFNVYAVGLGKPGGSANVDAVCIFDGSVILDPTTTALCAEELLSSGKFDFQVKRDSGKPVRQDISDVFRATGCIDLNASGFCDKGDLGFNNVWIFNIAQLLDYYWQYDNNGLKVMQVRFYETTSGSFGPL